MQKIGKIGIEDIPTLSRKDLIMVKLPFSDTLIDTIEGTIYLDARCKSNEIVRKLMNYGGDIYFNQEILNKYGSEIVNTAYKYYRELNKSENIDINKKIAILAWIADNIFDFEKMKTV